MSYIEKILVNKEASKELERQRILFQREWNVVFSFKVWKFALKKMIFRFSENQHEFFSWLDALT